MATSGGPRNIPEGGRDCPETLREQRDRDRSIREGALRQREGSGALPEAARHNSEGAAHFREGNLPSRLGGEFEMAGGDITRKGQVPDPSACDGPAPALSIPRQLNSVLGRESLSPASPFSHIRIAQNPRNRSTTIDGVADCGDEALQPRR